MDVRYASRGGVGGGGGCMTRYYGGGLYDVSMVERMMLKFRPIAPKPGSSGSGSGDSTTENGGKSGGGKRKYVRVKGTNLNYNGNNKDNKKRKVSTSSFHQPREQVVTLSLMPETPDPKENSPPDISSSVTFYKDNVVNQASRESHVEISTFPPEKRQAVVSWVKVEGAAETCVEKRWMEMESERCPGFISDGEDRVVWTNKAYREMAGGEEVVVVLVKKDGGYPAAFTCNVRVTCLSGRNCSTLTVPCDAWKMEGGGGGYAWRLDVKTALSLGR